MYMIDVRMDFEKPKTPTQWVRIIRPTQRLAIKRLRLMQKYTTATTFHYTIFDRKGMLEDSKGDTCGENFRNEWFYDVAYHD